MDDLIQELSADLASTYKLGPEEVLDVYLRAARRFAHKNHYRMERQGGMTVRFYDPSGSLVAASVITKPLINTVYELLRQTARERASRWPTGVQKVRVRSEEREFLAVESLDGSLYGVVPAKFRNALHPPEGQELLVWSSGTRILSQTDTRIVSYVFQREVPEIAEGTVEIVRIARLPGVRSKVAVRAHGNVNAVGACVGMRAARISAIRAALNGESVDVVPYEDDLRGFLAAAISPVKPEGVEIQDDAARIYVRPQDLTRAIGLHGDNAKLVALLTGLKIDVRSTERVAS